MSEAAWLFSRAWHGIGHSGPIEAPDRFVSLLERFVAEAAQTQTA